MKGPFRIKFKDYFGLEHEVIVYTNTDQDAIRQFLKVYDYPVEILSVELDYGMMIHKKYHACDFYEI